MYELLKLAALLWAKIRTQFEYMEIGGMDENFEIFIETFP